MEIYRIRNAEGEFSTGGMSPYFTKKGKVWKHLGHVKRHMSQMSDRELLDRYADCEIVTYQVEETISGVVPMMGFINGLRQLEIAKAEEAKIRQESYEKEQRRKQYEELQKEFGFATGPIAPPPPPPIITCYEDEM